jgi:hypothetical protein
MNIFVAALGSKSKTMLIERLRNHGHEVSFSYSDTDYNTILTTKQTKILFVDLSNLGITMLTAIADGISIKPDNIFLFAGDITVAKAILPEIQDAIGITKQLKS